MSAKAMFWAVVAAYYAAVAGVCVATALRRRRERRLAGMTAAERAAYARYWRWCY